MSQDEKQTNQQVASDYMKAKDHKAWAKRIIARIAANDKSVTPLQEKFAREALQ